MTFPEKRDETGTLNFKPNFGIMRPALKYLLGARRLCCWFSLLLATCAFGETGSRLALGDIANPDFFPILPWDPYHGWHKPFVERRPNGLESIADCHFNMAGFVQPRDLRRCEKLHLGAIVLPSDGDSTSPAYHPKWKKLSEEEIERRIEQIIRAAGKSPAIKGYFIMDEPGVADFPALGKAVAAVKNTRLESWPTSTCSPITRRSGRGTGPSSARPTTPNTWSGSSRRSTHRSSATTITGCSSDDLRNAALAASYYIICWKCGASRRSISFPA